MAIKFGSKTIKRGDKGKDVVELQLRLAGFRGTLWDGDFGPGTELQVLAFQRDYMKMKKPSGVATKKTLSVLSRFAKEFPLDFSSIRCQCGKCSGFGAGRFKGKYVSGKPKVEAFHQREYPGVHKAILHSARAAFFYASIGKYPSLYISSGYRCWIDNEQHDRTTTNHMGKAIDLDFVSPPNEPNAVDAERCAKFAGLLVEKGNFQLGWGANNRKALEPDSMAPTWIHMDVRSYEPQYLAEEYFVTSVEELDGMGS